MGAISEKQIIHSGMLRNALASDCVLNNLIMIHNGKNIVRPIPIDPFHSSRSLASLQAIDQGTATISAVTGLGIFDPRFNSPIGNQDPTSSFCEWLSMLLPPVASGTSPMTPHDCILQH